jgi:hypothetical protein
VHNDSEVAVAKGDDVHHRSLHRDPEPLDGAIEFLPQVWGAGPIGPGTQLVGQDHVAVIGSRRPAESLDACRVAE